MPAQTRLGPPVTGPAQELIDSGFTLENADAPLLHDGLNLADLAHVIDLHERKVIPPEATRALLTVLLRAAATPAAEFPYDPSFGEPYNSRERCFTAQIGDAAGWLHAGRPRREAVRIALRLHLRGVLTGLIAAAARLGVEIAGLAGQHTRTWLPDQTYLQHAQPSTFGHYLVSFAYPVLRDAERLSGELDGINLSPGGAGCVNGSRLLHDRSRVAGLLGFDGFIEHTRDAMWQIDGLIAAMSAASSLLTTQSKLAEDLEIWASTEFDYVSIADGYSRSSVLMPQKRNPYSLSIIRGASGTMIGRLSGFLAVSKSPSARSDNLIYAYGEVPRALDLALRTTRLTAGVISTLEVNTDRLWQALESGYSQSTDLAEFIMGQCGVDYRTAYQIVGAAVRKASRDGIRGVDLTVGRLQDAAAEYNGSRLDLDDIDLATVLDPRGIVATRVLDGGAAPQVVAGMAERTGQHGERLLAEAERRSAAIRASEDDLAHLARTLLAGLTEGEPR